MGGSAYFLPADPSAGRLKGSMVSEAEAKRLGIIPTPEERQRQRKKNLARNAALLAGKFDPDEMPTGPGGIPKPTKVELEMVRTIVAAGGIQCPRCERAFMLEEAAVDPKAVTNMLKAVMQERPNIAQWESDDEPDEPDKELTEAQKQLRAEAQAVEDGADAEQAEATAAVAPSEIWHEDPADFTANEKLAVVKRWEEAKERGLGPNDRRVVANDHNLTPTIIGLWLREKNAGRLVAEPEESGMEL